MDNYIYMKMGYNLPVHFMSVGAWMDNRISPISGSVLCDDLHSNIAFWTNMATIIRSIVLNQNIWIMR